MAEHGTTPSAEKQKGGQAGHRDHVRVFGHEKHGKLHRAVLGMVPGYQLSFGFRQVKWDTIRFRIGRHQIAEETDDLPGEDIPTRDKSPEMPGLRIDDRM